MNLRNLGIVVDEVTSLGEQLQLAQAEKFATEVLGVAAVDYDGNLEIANTCNRALLALKQRDVPMPSALKAKPFRTEANNSFWMPNGSGLRKRNRYQFDQNRSAIPDDSLEDRFGQPPCYRGVGKLANWPVKSLLDKHLAVCHAKSRLAKWQIGPLPFSLPEARITRIDLSPSTGYDVFLRVLASISCLRNRSETPRRLSTVN
jgi:hypothetical protein